MTIFYACVLMSIASFIHCRVRMFKYFIVNKEKAQLNDMVRYLFAYLWCLFFEHRLIYSCSLKTSNVVNAQQELKLVEMDYREI